MYSILQWAGARTATQVVLWGLGLAAGIELVTCAMRFGFELQSTRDTAFIAQLTFGFRIHHGYIGALMLLVALGSWGSGVRNVLYIFGIALFVSDFVHHFLVLWPITGSPEFHLRYPGT